MATRKQTSRRVSRATEDVLVKVVGGLTSDHIQEQQDRFVNALGANITLLGNQQREFVRQRDQLSELIERKQEELAELFNVEKALLDLETIRELREKEDEEYTHKTEQRDREWEEQLAEHQKEVQRRTEELEYLIQQRQQRAAEEHKARVEENQRLERIRHDDLERGWTEREEKLKEREEEIAEMKAKVEGFDTEKQKAVDEARTEITERLNSEHQHQQQVAQLTFDRQTSTLEARNSALVEEVAELKELLSKAQVQMDALRADNREVTTQALMATSNQQVAEALQRFGAEASNRGSKK